MYVLRGISVVTMGYSIDSLDVRFDEIDACYDCGHDANMNYSYGDELDIVPYVKNLSAFWEQGSPDSPACGPWHGGASRPYDPSSPTRHPRPSRGGRRKTSSGAASPGWLVRSGEIKARGYLARFPVT